MNRIVFFFSIYLKLQFDFLKSNQLQNENILPKKWIGFYFMNISNLKFEYFENESVSVDIYTYK
jgi:hypothetical protein